MKKIFFIVSLSIVFLMNCSSGIQMLPEPSEKGNLLIGSLTFDINGYNNIFLTQRENIDVAIVGKVFKNGRFETFGQWAVTDENGFFYLANVPDGEYAIKGFRTHLIGEGDLKIYNDLNDPQRNYFRLKTEGVIGLTGSLYDTKSERKIINFQHNIFTLFPNEVIRLDNYKRLRELKLSTGEIVDELPVPIYFLEQFEVSGWEDYLNFQLR